MTKIYILIITLLIAGNIMSQSCLPDGIHLTSQSEVDNFKANNLNCTEIEGSVEIDGSDITNLDSLHLITQIGGYFDIYSAPNLSDINGLSSLTTVGSGRLGIHGTALTDLNGLGNLASVPGLRIEENPLLSSLEGLNSLNTVAEGLYIIGNPSLNDLGGLEGLTSVGQGGTLVIEENENLASLDGIDNIIFNTLYEIEIWIRDNPLLSECETESICNLLDNSGIIHVSGNMEGCNTIDEVRAACQTSVGEVNQLHAMSICPNPAYSFITVKLSNQTSKVTSLAVTNLNGQQIITQQIFEHQTKLDISNLPAGIYIVKAWNDKEVMVRKMIKQ